MASWDSPRNNIYWDASPTSPLTPLSPTTLPQWLRSKKPRATILSNARIRIVGIAIACMLFGWMITSALGPSEEETLDLSSAEPYDISSGGVLDDPSGYGIGPAEEEGAADGLDVIRPPSVSSALSELHHAVSDKIQSWNPYRLHSTHQTLGGAKNKTASAKGKQKTVNVTDAYAAGESITDGISEEDRLGARTRIGKCTILFNGNSYWERAIRTHEQHDKLHGYRLHVLRQKLLDDVWSKPAYILALLLREMSKPEPERLEWLLWVDADTIILNPYIPVETFLPPKGPEFNDVNLIYCNDWNGLNNGIFPVRVSVWAVELFSAIVSFRHYRPDDTLVFRDQSAMSILMQEPRFAKNIVQAPQRWFNAYQGEHNETLAPFQIRRGDLLVHFAGVGDRETRMGYWLDRAEQHLDDWEIPVKSTSYPQEARDFWSEQRDARKNKQNSLVELRLKATQLLQKTEQRLNEYGERLTGEETGQINAAREYLKKIIENEHWSDDVSKVVDATAKLDAISSPLTNAISTANKVLLNSAHEAIFAGEKDLLDSGFNAGVESPELQQIAETIKGLKNLVMSPEEFWNKADITVATNAVTEARARVQEKKAAEQGEKKAQEDRVKALEEARKQVLAEADAAVLQAATTIQVVSMVAVETVVPVQTVTGHVVTVTPEAVMVWTTETVVHETDVAVVN